MTRVVFLGTPRAAVPTLEALSSSSDVALVVTRPDRPRGRSKRPMPPPVKKTATSLGIPIAQPSSHEELWDSIAEAGPVDVGVVVAYGRLLKPEVLEFPVHGMVNVHFSLLPRWRGAAPVERALMAGDEMTGVSIIKLDEGLDTGPVLTAQAIDISHGENGGELTERLAHVGARLVVSVLEDYVAGRVRPVSQTDEGVTYAHKITAEDRPLDTGGTVLEFVNKVRALAPSPAATLDMDGERHKVFSAAPHDAAPRPGTWEVNDGLPIVGARDGGVALIELQPPGRNRQSGEDWVRGRRRSGGSVD